MRFHPAAPSMIPHVTLALALLAVGGPVLAAPDRTLSFDERVVAPQAIERVYYQHQVGATQAFAEAVPREVLERKVCAYLDETAALEHRRSSSPARRMGAK